MQTLSLDMQTYHGDNIVTNTQLIAPRLASHIC